MNLLMRGQETSGLAWVFKLQTLFEINQTKKNNNPKKAKLLRQEKSRRTKTVFSSDGKIICDQLPTFSLQHPSGNDKDFVITNNKES